MRFAPLGLLVALALSWNSFAQVPSLKEGETFEGRPPGTWERVLDNHGASALVAYYEAFSCPKDGTVVKYDALVYSGNRDISPGESVVIEADDPSRCSGAVNAAIFSDGHAEGDPRFLDALYSTRRGAYKALGESIQLLNSIQSEHKSIPHIVDTLMARKQASSIEKTWTAHGYIFALSTVLRMLTDTRTGHHSLPSDNDGQKPPAVESVMNATGLSRDEARAIVISKRLEEWKALLENSLQPVQ